MVRGRGGWWCPCGASSWECVPRVLSWWGGQRTRRGEHEQGVANGWPRVGLGATDLSVHRSLGSTVFAVGDDYAHTSRHIVSLCVFSCDMITFDESCVRRREGEIILSPEGGQSGRLETRRRGSLVFARRPNRVTHTYIARNKGQVRVGVGQCPCRPPPLGCSRRRP